MLDPKQIIPDPDPGQSFGSDRIRIRNTARQIALNKKTPNPEICITTFIKNENHCPCDHVLPHTSDFKISYIFAVFRIQKDPVFFADPDPDFKNLDPDKNGSETQHFWISQRDRILLICKILV